MLRTAEVRHWRPGRADQRAEVSEGPHRALSSSGRLESSLRELTVDLPGLEVGDTVLLEVVRSIESLPLADLYSYSFFGAGRDSVARSVLTVDWPSERELFYVSEGFEPPRVIEEGDRTRFVWRREGGRAYDRAPLSRPVWERAPRVVLSSHRPAEASRELWSALDSFCDPSRESRTADSLLAAVGTDPDQLTRWVRESIDYLGSDWGDDPGYSPRPPVETLAGRSGVCRDVAVLLTWLLRAAGHRASLALCNTSHDLDDLVGSRSFNHMLVALTGPEGEIRVIDPSLEVSADLPMSMRGRRYLVLSPGGAELRRAPDPIRGDSMTVVFEGSLSEDFLTMEGEVVVRTSGAVDQVFAGILQRLGEERFLEFIRAYLSADDRGSLVLASPPGAGGGMTARGRLRWSLPSLPSAGEGTEVLLPGISELNPLATRNAVLLLCTYLDYKELLLQPPINEKFTLRLCGLPEGYRPPESLSAGTFESRAHVRSDTLILVQCCSMGPAYPGSLGVAGIVDGLLARSSPAVRILGLP